MKQQDKPGISKYFPVLFFSPERELQNKPLLLGKPHEYWSWWYKGKSVFYHDGLLLNAYTSRAEGDKRHILNIGPDCRVLIDSGGFQLYKQTVLQGKKLNIKPIDILRTQEQWGDGPNDASFIIDYPVGADDNDSMFDFCLAETKKTCELYQAEMQSDSLRMLNVLHGHTMERIKVWYDTFHKFRYRGRTGWSVGFHPSSDVMNQARMFAFIWSQQTESEPLEYFHFLGVSGWNTMPLLVYASRFADEVVFDSSSYGSGYKTKTYMMPNDIDRGGDVVFGDQIQSWHELVEPPCNCPVCLTVREADVSFPDAMLDPNGGGHLISLHNMFQYIDRSRKLHALVADKERYLKYVSSHCSKEALLACQYLDEVKRVGFDSATRDFGRFFKRTHENQLAVSFGSMFQSSGVEKLKEKDAIRISVPDGELRKRGKKKMYKEAGKKVLCPTCQEALYVTPGVGIICKRDHLFKTLEEMISSNALGPTEPVVETAEPDEVEAEVALGVYVEQFLTHTEAEKAESEPALTPVQRGEAILKKLEDTGTANIDVPNLGKPTPRQPNLSEPEKQKKPRKVKEAPKLLEIPSDDGIVHLEVVKQKPECYGQFEPAVCDGSFCGEWLLPCSKEEKST